MIFILIGLAIGSFLNVVIVRTPKNESIVHPRSHCPKCKKTIPFYYNIPVASYIWLRGRCFSCKQKISFQYIAIEIATSLIFFTTFSSFEFNEAVLLSLVFCVLIVLSVIDLRYYLIPLYAIIILYILVLIRLYIIKDIIISDIILGSILTSLYLGVPSVLVSFLKNKERVLGEGDILLSVFVGGWLGIIDGITCLFLASIIGILITISRKLTDTKESKIPFGLCISLSFFIVIHLKEYLDTNLFF